MFPSFSDHLIIIFLPCFLIIFFSIRTKFDFPSKLSLGKLNIPLIKILRKVHQSVLFRMGGLFCLDSVTNIFKLKDSLLDTLLI